MKSLRHAYFMQDPLQTESLIVFQNNLVFMAVTSVSFALTNTFNYWINSMSMWQYIIYAKRTNSLDVPLKFGNN